jgi:hypothetical protein
MKSPRLALLALFAAGCFNDFTAATPDASVKDVPPAGDLGADATPPPDGSTPDAASPDGTAPDATADAPSDGPPATCPAAQRCGASCCLRTEICGGGRCCAPSARCGAVCCAPDQVCREGFCALDCGSRALCETADGARCCAEGEVCAFGRCAAPGAACDEINPCPAGSYCELTLRRCLASVTPPRCEFRPPPGRFTPTERWHWRAPATPAALAGHTMVMMSPMVANLTDDNGDGRIDARDTPDVVFNAYADGLYYGNGVLRAITGDTGRDLWPTSDLGYRVMPGASVAIAELDATRPGPEIVTCTPKVGGTTCCDGTAGHAIILGADGTRIRELTDVPCGYSAPAVADMNGDGVPEIAVRGAVFHADGAVLFNHTTDTGPISTEDFALLADLDGAADGNLELYTGITALRYDGSTLWTHSPSEGRGYPAIADLNPAASDGPEVVIGGLGSLRAFRARDGATVAGWMEPAMIRGGGGGPPTIADFDGDGQPDVAYAGASAYGVFRGASGAQLWTSATQDMSSSVTGSSVFDFDGDGAAEAVYNDELRLRIYDGSTGMVRLDQCNTNATLWEYPVIVDVDNDRHAEIIVSQNPYPGTSCGTGGDHGVRAFAGGDAMTPSTWVATRRIWNQHTYHVTNINEDASVPRREVPNWTIPYLNNFRQNVQPGATAAPDLRGDMVPDLTACATSITLRARVTNVGAAGAPAGVTVTFYQGDPGPTRVRLGERRLTRSLLPGDREVVSLPFPLPVGMETASFVFFAVINDPETMPLAELHDCDTNNNVAGPIRAMCDLPP